MITRCGIVHCRAADNLEIVPYIFSFDNINQDNNLKCSFFEDDGEDICNDSSNLNINNLELSPHPTFINPNITHSNPTHKPSILSHNNSLSLNSSPPLSPNMSIDVSSPTSMSLNQLNSSSADLISGLSTHLNEIRHSNFFFLEGSSQTWSHGLLLLHNARLQHNPNQDVRCGIALKEDFTRFYFILFFVFNNTFFRKFLEKFYLIIFSFLSHKMSSF
jgi:hypothetical protein